MEYPCWKIDDVGGDDEPVGHCQRPSIVVNIRLDEGRCLRHLVVPGTFELSELMRLLDLYWAGYVWD